MKNIHIIIFSILALILSSCEEVIDIDLNESDPNIVIEAILKDVPDGNLVTITETGSYFAPGNYPRISNAIVRLTDQDGNEEILQETEPGDYPILETVAKTGETYTLTIEVEGEVYEASSVVQTPLAPDSIGFEINQSPRFSDPDRNRLMIARIQDPPGRDNFLLLEAEVNGELSSVQALYDGRSFDGGTGLVPFIGLNLAAGDSVKVISYAIDKDAFDYYNTLASLSGQGFGGGSTTPANPTTNWSNGALGFFGTLAVSEVEVVVP